MTALTAPTKTAGRRHPKLDHGTAMRLAATEYDRFLDQLRRLPEDAWSRPTACPGWDVHAMACHVLGMAEMSASVRESVRQMRTATRTAKRDGTVFIDALTALQIAEHRDLSPAAVIEQLATSGPAAARGRKRTPAPARRWIPVGEQPIDETGTVTEPWSLGYLNDVILTRDPWMHRSDIAATVGIEMRLSADHDGVLVADIAAEWASRHGQACQLRLTGPAGGEWTWGTGGPSIEIDTVEFCRVLSGRGSGDGLLATRVPF
jgi:uncharacterized protein (TIGR03083 family)